MVFLLPASPVHAASPTVSLSTISASGALTAATSGTVGSTLVITGSGFNSASTITITTTVGTTSVTWLTAGGKSTTTPPVDSLVVGGALTTTSIGNFAVEVLVPSLPGGAQTITVSDGVNSGTATFSITPKVSITYTGNNFGFPEEAITPSIAVSGFGSGESVTISTPMWTTTSFSCSTGSAVGTYGAGTCGTGTSVADTNGGAKTVTATGATSGLTAQTTYTVNPWAAFYNSETGTTSFSFTGSAPTSLLVEVHGMAAGTIAPNSITIGGVSTNHQSVVIGTTGAYGGSGSFIVVSPTANVPFGVSSVVISGTTFSYAAGNIARASGTWGGVVISSIATLTGVGTGVVTTDASSYKPGTGFTSTATTTAGPQQNQIGVFGYGFVSGNAITITASAGLSVANVIAPGNANTVGAFFATYTLADTPWSTAGAPTTASTYTLTTTEAVGAPANVLSPSFGITPWIQGPTTTSADFSTNIAGAKAHGFSAGDTLTLKIGGTAVTTAGTCGPSVNGSCSLHGTLPDIAGGSQSVTVTGSLSGQTSTSGTSVTVHAIASSNGASTILPNSGSAGTTAVVRTGATYGVHGLAANTAYTIVWNSISGSVTVGSFTSTATGGIPVPGVQITVPSDSSGVHVIDIQTAAGASAFFGSTVEGDVAPSAPLAADQTAYGDLLFSNTATLQATPSVASIGTPESISGNGLASATQYIVTLGSLGGCTASVTAPALGSFTTTAAGAVPSSTSLTLTDTPTTTETGSVENFVMQTATNFGVVGGAVAACAQFVLAATATDNATSVPAGHAVTLKAHALNGGGAVYDIVFNYALSALGNSYTGTIVGVVAPSSTGAATTTWNVPAGTQPGTYPVQLVISTRGTSTLAAGAAVLNIPLSVTVGSVSTTSCNTTSCMAVNGQPTQTTQGAYNGISSQFTNNSNAPVTGFVYAVVHNALGQTVDISTATITAPAGGSVSAFNALFGLAPGTYSVTLFVTSSAGTAISTTSTVSVTIP